MVVFRPEANTHRWYIICVHGGALRSPPFPLMAVPLKITFSHLEEGPSTSKVSFWEDPSSSGVAFEKSSSSKATYGGSPEDILEEKRGEDDMRPMVSLMPPVNVEHGSFHDLMSARMWGNHVIWRAGVSVVTISNANMPPKESSHPFSDHRGCSFRVAELYIWPLGRDTIDLATRSGTRRDTHWQHARCVVYHLRYGRGDRCTHQLNSDDGHRILRTLSSRASSDLHLLPTLRGRTRREYSSRGSGENARVQNPQWWLLDRSRRGSQRLASSLHRVCLRVYSFVRHVFSRSVYPVKFNCSFTPGSWVTELDWIHGRLSYLARNTDQCS